MPTRSQVRQTAASVATAAPTSSADMKDKLKSRLRELTVGARAAMAKRIGKSQKSE